MHSSSGNTGSLQEERLGSSKWSTWLVLSPRKGNAPQRLPNVSPWMVGKAKKKRKSDQTQPPEDSLRGCTWSSARPCWCAQPPPHNLRTCALPRKSWTHGMSGSMGRTLQAALPHRRRPSCSMQRGMHGGRSMTWSMWHDPEWSTSHHQIGPFILDPWSLWKGQQTDCQEHPNQGEG